MGFYKNFLQKNARHKPCVCGSVSFSIPRKRIHHTPEGACVLRYIVIFHGNISVSVIDAYAVSDQDYHRLSLL